MRVVLAQMRSLKEPNAMKTLAPSPEITKPRRIGVLIYPGCDILDVCGPCEAFHWADVWLPRFGRADKPGYECHVLAATAGPVQTISGIEVVATHSFHDIGDGLDTLVVAGGVISGEQACEDPALVEWVRSIAPRVRRVASVCTGTFILAAAGLLNDRLVTTHWMFSDALATEYPSIKVDSSLLFHRDGNIYSSGGSQRGSISLWPWLKKISAGKSPLPPRG